MEDKVARNRQSKGAQVPSAKLTEPDIVTIRESSDTAAQLAERYGVTEYHIRAVRKRKQWAWVS